MRNIKKAAGVGLIAVVLIAVVGVLVNQLGYAHAATAKSNQVNISAQPLIASKEVSKAQKSVVIPAGIAVPAGNILAFQATGQGVLMYACPVTAASVDVPLIVVYNVNKTQTIGTHYAINGELIWEDLLGNSVVAVPQAKIPSPNGSAPWVLLKVQAHHGSGLGMLSNVTFIQRVNTMGGTPNAANCMGNNQAQESIPFATTYLFYKKAA